MEEKRTIRALVARMADDADSGFKPGSIEPRACVPVLLEFDPTRPIGWARIRVQGSEVYADLTLLADHGGLYPALGGTADAEPHRIDGRPVFESFNVQLVGLSQKPNADPQIPAIGG